MLLLHKVTHLDCHILSTYLSYLVPGSSRHPSISKPIKLGFDQNNKLALSHPHNLICHLKLLIHLRWVKLLHRPRLLRFANSSQPVNRYLGSKIFLIPSWKAKEPKHKHLDARSHGRKMQPQLQLLAGRQRTKQPFLNRLMPGRKSYQSLCKYLSIIYTHYHVIHTSTTKRPALCPAACSAVPS